MKKEQLVKLFKCVSLLSSINYILILNDLIEIEQKKMELEDKGEKEIDSPKILVLKRKYYG